MSSFFNPSTWTSVGFCAFWLLSAFAAPRIMFVEGIYRHRINKWNWMENFSLVAAFASLNTNSEVVTLIHRAAVVIPGGVFAVGTAIVNIVMTVIHGIGG